MGIINLKGHVFGRLTVISYDKSKNRVAYWLCRCECGKEKSIRGDSLRSRTLSCGCLTVEKAKLVNLHHGHTKGGKVSAEFRAWWKMKMRCYNENTNTYKNYGGRGIKVCNQWINSFETFLNDMGIKPSTKHSLDRYPNNDGNYEPGNCRWATRKEQVNNRRTTKIVKYKGIDKPLSNWVDDLGLDYHTVMNRITSGLTIEDAFEKPVIRRKHFHLNKTG